MSDLANSCEYLTVDKLCSAVLESPKAKANRELRCGNDEKTSCCYLCQSRRECAVSCKYLGGTENAPVPLETQKIEKSTVSPVPVEVNAPKNLPVAYCSSCNVEMAPKKTKLRIDGWEPEQKQYDAYSTQKDEILHVIAYLCPCCGRIEFRADK